MISHITMQRPAATLLAASLLALAAPGCTTDWDAEAAKAFDRSVVHRIDITVDAEYLGELETNLEARVPCTFTFDDVTIDEAGIRQKGGTNSLRDIDIKPEGEDYKPQPSFSVRLDEFDENGDLYGLRKIILNSSAQDPTFLHQHFGSDLAIKAGLPAARTTHGIVRLNGVPFGLYIVTESIDTDFLGRAFGSENDQGNLYEGRKVDFTDVASLELKDEDKEDRERDDLQALADVVLSTPSAELASAVRARMDLDRFITAFAFETAINHWDGFAFNKNNYYLYNNPADDRFVFIPHGMDRIVQTTYPDEDNPTKIVERDTLNDDPEALLPALILQTPELRAAYIAELARIANEVWDLPSINAEIDRIAAVVGATKPTGVRDANDIALFNANLSDWRDALTKRRETLLSVTSAESPGDPTE
jgi:spore coat protein CotH